MTLKDIQFFGGLVTALEPGKIKVTDAGDLVNVEVENGSVIPAFGYRNVLPPVTNQTTMKGAHWCQTYVSGVLTEAFVTFDKVSGTLKPYELAYTLATDNWARTVITGPASAPLSLNDTYWRRVCFNDLVYFFNAQDTNPVNKYTIGDYDSWVPVKPPASPSDGPGVVYYLNALSRSYSKWLGAASGYAAGDVSADNTVADTTVALTGQSVKVTIKAVGHFTVTFSLKHSGGSVDFSNNDVFSIDVSVDDTSKIVALLKSLKASIVSSTGPVTQELQVSVVNSTEDASGNLKSVKLYLKFAGKSARSTWATATQLIIEGDISQYASNSYLFFSPLISGGMVDWGNSVTQWRLMYTREESTTTLESGPSLAKNLDRNQLAGQFLNGDPNFPMGTVPLVSMTAAGDSDTLRLYAQKLDGTKKPSVWRRVVEQSDATLTYTYTTLVADFEALTEYAPSDFDYSKVIGAFQFKQCVVWLYQGGLDNVRLSRYRNAIAQASTNDAFRTDLGQDDDERGVNFTISNKALDQPIGGAQLGDAAIILSSNGAYLCRSVGPFPKDTLPPQPISGAPGCFGPEAFCEWKDPNSGEPIIVYLAAGGDSLWAIRVPAGFDPGQPVAQACFEIASNLRNGFNDAVFGASALRDSESIAVYVDERNDSLHVRYNAHEVVLRRPSLVDGKRKWVAKYYDTAQWASSWEKVVFFKSSAVGFGIFGFRLNGAVDEFETASLKHPTSGDRVMTPLDGAAFTPASLSISVATFTLPPGWSSGTPVTVQTTGNGLTAGTQYYVGRVTYLTYSFYTTQANAQAAGATGRVTLTSTGAWAAGAVTPSGPMDGSDFTNVGCYWQTKKFGGHRRRAFRLWVDKEESTDSVIVYAYSDRSNSGAVTIASGDRYARFGPQVSGDSTTYRISLTARHSGVNAMRIEELDISQKEHN